MGFHKGNELENNNHTFSSEKRKGNIALIFLQKFTARTLQLLNEPVHEISNNVVCATSKASDQPSHTRSLIRAFASRLSFLLLFSY